MPKHIFTLLFLIISFNLSAKSHIEEMEKRLVSLINNERTKRGLNALKVWKPLTLAARAHSQNMANKTVPFGHQGFEQRASSLNKEAFIFSLGENVAYSFGVSDHLQTALKGWLNSPGHYKNIVGDFKETGIGIALTTDGQFYVTQLFAIKE